VFPVMSTHVISGKLKYCFQFILHADGKTLLFSVIQIQ
jgi:hypothetical protein